MDDDRASLLEPRPDAGKDYAWQVLCRDFQTLCRGLFRQEVRRRSADEADERALVAMGWPHGLLCPAGKDACEHLSFGTPGQDMKHADLMQKAGSSDVFFKLGNRPQRITNLMVFWVVGEELTESYAFNWVDFVFHPKFKTAAQAGAATLAGFRVPGPNLESDQHGASDVLTFYSYGLDRPCLTDVFKVCVSFASR